MRQEDLEVLRRMLDEYPLEEVLDEITNDFDVSTVLECLDADGQIIDYAVRYCDEDSLLDGIRSTAILEKTIDTFSVDSILSKLDNNDILEYISDYSITPKNYSLNDKMKQDHLDSIFDMYSLEEIEEKLPLKYFL